MANYTLQEGEDRREQRRGELPLEPGRGQQRGVGRVDHVAALDKHLGHRGEVEPRGRCGTRCRGCRNSRSPACRYGQAGPRARPWPNRSEVRMTWSLGPSATGSSTVNPRPRPAAVGVDVDRHPRARAIEYLRPAVHARPDAVVVLPGHHHVRAVGEQGGTQIACHVEVVPRLGVTAGGLGAGGVTCLVFPAVPNEVIDVAGVGAIEAVMAGVDADGYPGERLGRRGRLRGRGGRARSDRTAAGEATASPAGPVPLAAGCGLPHEASRQASAAGQAAAASSRPRPLAVLARGSTPAPRGQAPGPHGPEPPGARCGLAGQAGRPHRACPVPVTVWLAPRCGLSR